MSFGSILVIHASRNPSTSSRDSNLLNYNFSQYLLMIFWIWVVSAMILLFSFLISLICIFSFFLFISLSILFIIFNEPALWFFGFLVSTHFHKRPTTQNINKEIWELIHSFKQMHLIAIYSALPCYNRTHISLSSRWIFSKTDHILAHKACLNKHKRIETIPCILTDPNRLT